MAIQVVSTPQMRGAIFTKEPPIAPYVHQAWPSLRYHPDGRIVRVESEDAAKALGEEWAAAPFPPKPKPAPKAEVSKTVLETQLKTLTELHEELKVYSAEKTAENLQLRAELAKLKVQMAGASEPASDADPAEAATDEAPRKAKARK